MYNNLSKLKAISVILALVGLLSTNSFAFENLVYTYRGLPGGISQTTTAIDDFKTHVKQINILSSQAYVIDMQGVVYGFINPQLQKLANENKVNLMPFVTNNSYDRAQTHTFLLDNVAQKRAIDSLLTLCKQNHFYGLQIDFEGMSFLDRNLFTQFYKKVADTLHQNGYKVSVAVVPALSDAVPASNYLKGRYRGWTGVYDYKALGDYSDFVTLMAYGQHGSDTTPGPMASLQWDEAIINYSLKYIPADKVSLGIPWFSGYWFTGAHTTNNSTAISSNGLELEYKDAMRFVNDYNVPLQWSAFDKIHYAIYQHNFLYEYIYLEDLDSFKAKLELVQKYHLRGISNWYLGSEDARVWQALPNV